MLASVCLTSLQQLRCLWNIHVSNSACPVLIMSRVLSSSWEVPHFHVFFLSVMLSVFVFFGFVVSCHRFLDPPSPTSEAQIRFQGRDKLVLLLQAYARPPPRESLPSSFRGRGSGSFFWAGGMQKYEVPGDFSSF